MANGTEPAFGYRTIYDRNGNRLFFGSDVPNFAAFARPLILKSGEVLRSLKELALAPCIAPGVARFIVPPRRLPPSAPAQCRLMIFPRFAKSETLSIEPLTPAQAGLELMRCNVNARNLAAHGFDVVSSLARSVPAVVLHYGSFEQLNGVLDIFAGLVLENDWNAKTFSDVFRSVGTPLVARELCPGTGRCYKDSSANAPKAAEKADYRHGDL